MSDATNTEFTREQLSSQAQGNATAFVLTTFAHLKERGLDPEEYAAFSGAVSRPAGKSCAVGRSQRSRGRRR